MLELLVILMYVLLCSLRYNIAICQQKNLSSNKLDKLLCSGVKAAPHGNTYIKYKYISNPQ